MDSFHLHFKHGKQPDLPLIPGVNPICRGAHGVTLAAGTAESIGTLGQFRLDDRGLWLHLAESAQGVHVNGRPVHRLALLRSGDTLHLDAQEIQVVGRSGIRPETSAEPGSRTGNTILLRGIGGVHHGRSYPLHRPCTLGNDKDADIRLEEGSAPGILVQLEPDGESLRLQLRSQEGAGTLQVNGREVRQARLYCGDQLTLGAQSRFVVETPWPLKLHADTNGETGARREKQRAAAGQSLPPALPSRRWPWLLLVAGLLGGLLCVLLLFGAK